MLIFQGNIHSNIQITKGVNIHSNIQKIISNKFFKKSLIFFCHIKILLQE